MWRVLLCALLLAGAGPSSPGEKAADRPAVAIDSTIITMRDLDLWALEAALVRPELERLDRREQRRRVAPRAVDERLLADWARTVVESIPPETVQGRVAEFYAEFARWGLTDRVLEAELSRLGAEREEFHRWLVRRAEDRSYIDEAIGAYVTIGIEDALEGAPAGAVSYQLQMLVWPYGTDREAAYAAAVRARHQIAGGLAFPAVMRLAADPEPPALAARAVDLGWVDREALAPEILTALATMGRETTSDVVPTREGWALIHLVEFESPRQREYRLAIGREQERRLAEQRELRQVRYAESLLPTE
jgi:hypothetical protein